MGEIRTEALIHDLAIVLGGVLHQRERPGYSPDVAASRIRDVLGITPGELTAGIEDALTRALGQPIAELAARLPRGEWGADELGTLANWLTGLGYDVGGES